MHFDLESLKDPLNLLILLGFICQGFAWENMAFPAIFALLWLLCILTKRQKRLIPEPIEFLIFFLAFVLSFKLGGQGGGTRILSYYTRTMSLGNSLLVIQGIRLLRPISKREKIFACAIAVTHLAIGSHFLLDYPFILILVAAVLLVPRVLNQTMQEGYRFSKPFKLRENIGVYTLLIVLTAVFFIVFPRRRIIRTSGMNVLMATQGPIQPQIDPSLGGTESSDAVIFRIEGENLGYLKCFALDEFDGALWKASKWSYQARSARREIPLDTCKSRKVKVNYLDNMGNSLPTDGYVVDVRGNFFQDAYVRIQDSIGVSTFWPASSNEYEYWMKDDLYDLPAKNELARCLAHPAQSVELKSWLANAVGQEKDPFGAARRIQSALRDGCKYEIGAANLSRLSPVEDFVLREKRGHCERFASAAAVLLRMQGIPSRVGIGYVPGEKNQFADFYSVRARDAHAWAEAYIEGHGWTIFDATPVGEGRVAAPLADLALSARDWLEYVWYSKIVNFSMSDQQSIMSYTFGGARTAKEFLLRNMSSFFVSALILMGALFLFRFGRRLLGFLCGGPKKRPSAMEATHFYGEMLQLLAKDKLYRESSETPLEFLGRTKRSQYAEAEQTRIVTEIFCDIKYGGRELGATEKKRIQAALRQIRSRR